MAIFQSWRLRLREVEATIKVGRLDEAFEMLTQSGLMEYFPAKRLSEQLALLYAERAKRRARARDFSGGWKDWESSVKLAELPAADVARRCLVDASGEHVEQLVSRGEFSEAAAQLDRLEKYAASHSRVQSLRKFVRCLQSAQQLGRRGRFVDAVTHLDQALAERPNSSDIELLRESCRENSRRVRDLSEQLYRALSDSNYREAIAFADQLLQVAPEMKLAQDARKKAWQQVGARVDTETQGNSPFAGSRVEPDALRENADPLPSPRFLLWIDGVGGYLVCLGSEVVLGQSTAKNNVDIPILGDLSRKHARIRRSGEGYVVDPWQSVKVNGKSITRSAVLCDGDELELGSGVRFRYRRPHPLSLTARLEPLSRHRTHPYTDGILLMAESCVLGPSWSDHVVCRDWSSNVVLSHTDGQLYCRSLLPIEVDGQVAGERGRIDFNSRIVGSDFSMCLEELDKCSRQPLV